MDIPITNKMRERIKAGLAFFYTTQDGHEWYIDATLNFPFRQIDFQDAMYDAFDGRVFEAGYPSLSVCQLALEENCTQWRGEGWYFIGNKTDEGADVEAYRIASTDELKEHVVIARGRFDVYGEPCIVRYAGDGDMPMLS